MEEKIIENKNEVLVKGVVETGIAQTEEELEKQALELLASDEMLNELNAALLDYDAVYNLTNYYYKYCRTDNDRENFKKSFGLTDYAFYLINKYKYINFYFISVVAANNTLYKTEHFLDLDFNDEKDKIHASYIKQYIRLQNKFFTIKNAHEFYDFAREVRETLRSCLWEDFTTRLKNALRYFDMKEIQDKIINLRKTTDNSFDGGMCYFVRLYRGYDALLGSNETDIGVSIRCKDLKELAQCIERLSKFENVIHVSYESACDKKSIELFLAYYRRYNRFAKRFVAPLYLCDFADLERVIEYVLTNECTFLFWGEKERKRIKEALKNKNSE